MRDARKALTAGEIGELMGYVAHNAEHLNGHAEAMQVALEMALRQLRSHSAPVVCKEH